MALGFLPPNPETWGRWPQHQHTGADCGMMDAGMVPYDCRPGATASIPRPELAQHFLPGPFNPASVPSPASPQYHAPVSYGGYSPYNPSSMLEAPFKPHGLQGRMDGLPLVGRSSSPSVKSEAKSTKSESPSPSTKVVIPNVRVQGAPVHEFNTAIDRLAKVIETKREILSSPNPAKEEPGQPNEGVEGGEMQQARGKAKRKRFCCDIPGCSKMFAQKNNLDTHRRAHTGESPYVCPICLHRFTQSVNLKSHIRRHLGERPYKCPQCPKAFSQPSNVKAHMKTHERRELRARWSHQNTYHVEAIEAFHAKLASIEDKSMITEEDKEMARYITEVHNLANKGIKGRGKGRKVKRLLPLPMQPSSAAAAATTTTTTTSLSAATAIVHGNPYSMPPLLPHAPPHHLQAAPQPSAAHHGHQHHHFYGLSNPAAYSMSRPSVSSAMLFGVGLGINTRDVVHGHGAYGMLDSDQISEASSVHSPPPVMHHVYDDEHARELAFGERLY
ncbi:cde855a6-0318-4496-a2f5-645bfa3dfa69 [Thermothielavioides terrestris]|uniref:Cde855a6-0318-4496-a2f5-645bfa3dfa69 n=1 Tax=Thermothielavioides terrestris TaxID=2587410 RepID=A0A3S4AM34_9PEZI|nr:cde855a6-0318-4496-a2f5-645bfa3dfa69 [Thermothielavioides terrestris]